MRSLSPEEAALWARVTATIAPLSREKISTETREEEPEIVRPKPSPLRLARKTAQAPASAAPRLGTSLDGTWDRRIRSGAIEPDRVLDLHGMNLDRAWQAIDRTLESAINRQQRVVLLITGHHRPGEAPVQRGRIRAAVHDWLSASRHAPRIAAVRGAHRRHGAGGSLYIILRR